MERDRILAGVSKEDLGIEIAPWFNPVVPKRDGYNVRTLDVYDFDTLKSRAKTDPSVPEETYENLEEIDYIGSAGDIVEIVPETAHSKFKYVISSHNFEHLPNPIKFLKGCEVLLQPGGLVSMVVPDLRGMFDYFRPWTVTADWIEAFIENREAPTGRQIFEHQSSYSSIQRPDGTEQVIFPFDQPIDTIRLSSGSAYPKKMANLLAGWKSKNASGYIDCHCSVMTPSSLELMLLDCRMLGLTQLEVESIESFGTFEFFVRLRKPLEPSPQAKDMFANRRSELMRQTLIERKMGINDADVTLIERKMGINDADVTLVDALRRWNKARVRRRRLRRQK